MSKQANETNISLAERVQNGRELPLVQKIQLLKEINQLPTTMFQEKKELRAKLGLAK